MTLTIYKAILEGCEPESGEDWIEFVEYFTTEQVAIEALTHAKIKIAPLTEWDKGEDAVTLTREIGRYSVDQYYNACVYPIHVKEQL